MYYFTTTTTTDVIILILRKWRWREIKYFPKCTQIQTKAQIRMHGSYPHFSVLPATPPYFFTVPSEPSGKASFHLAKEIGLIWWYCCNYSQVHLKKQHLHVESLPTELFGNVQICACLFQHHLSRYSNQVCPPTSLVPVYSISPRADHTAGTTILENHMQVCVKS